MPTKTDDRNEVEPKMDEKNYVAYHVHTELSLLDSTTKHADYIARAKELGQTAIAFSEHGNIYQWVDKKIACDEAGVKYIHGVEIYITQDTVGEARTRDNFHTILLARNMDGLRELNLLVGNATREDHFYYKPRITMDEFFAISENIIRISACLGSPLNKLPVSHPLYERIVKHYHYLEIQPHNCRDQIIYNRHLADLSAAYHIPLIAGTDTHNISPYKADCRAIIMDAKKIQFSDEDELDLTYKSRQELEEMFERQDALPKKLWMEAIDNTNRMADSVESFELDLSFKYPKLYGERDGEVFRETIRRGLEDKIRRGIIPAEQTEAFEEAIREEMRVFEKIDMQGFMLFMSELVSWCKSSGIPVGFNRGSCGGSRVAYVTDITDLNPETWHTVFSRFCNEDRREIGDIDIDIAPSDRARVYDYIISRFGEAYTAFIFLVGTAKAKACVDEICRGLSVRWLRENTEDERPYKQAVAALRDNAAIVSADRWNGKLPFAVSEGTVTVFGAHFGTNDREQIVRQINAMLDEVRASNKERAERNPWTLALADRIKSELNNAISDAAAAGDPGTKPYRDALLASENYKCVARKYKELFYYYEGVLDVAVSASMHPAGIVASPVTLADNYGVFWSDGKRVLPIDMECVHEVSLVKYDILGLKTIGIIRDTYQILRKPYPLSHEIDWNDSVVWKDMLRSPTGIFEFEKEYAHSLLRQYQPASIYDMSLVTAALRPSGASYRDDLMKHIPHKNPSPMIDELLRDNHGYLVYQEDVIKFLQLICGFSGSEADNTRRAIGRKDHERLQKALPHILDGYCARSPQPREIAQREAREFLQIIEDASSYMFGYNHSVGYCMLGYLCAYLRCYHPAAFITAYLNNAANDDDTQNGTELAQLYNVRISPPRFGLSRNVYSMSGDANVIAKGVSSIKYLSSAVAEELYEIAHHDCPETFMELLMRMKHESSLDARQRGILIRIDFFERYGNARSLLRLTDWFDRFKGGDAKVVKKSALSPDEERLIADFATDRTKAGKISTQYTITDMRGFLNAYEKIIKNACLDDFDLKSKMASQQELLGYVDITTGNESDRRKLLITDVFALHTKDKTRIWAYVLRTRSIGSGKISRLTLRAGDFDRIPVRKMDVIYALRVHKDRSGYWYLDQYTHLA